MHRLERWVSILTEEAKAARRAYARKYREKNRERINAQHKKWRDSNPDKVKANAARYWERQAAQDR